MAPALLLEADAAAGGDADEFADPVGEGEGRAAGDRPAIINLLPNLVGFVWKIWQTCGWRRWRWWG